MVAIVTTFIIKWQSQLVFYSKVAACDRYTAFTPIGGLTLLDMPTSGHQDNACLQFLSFYLDLF